MIIGYKAWKKQGYLLDRMSLRDLVRAYFTYPTIQIYLLLTAGSVWLTLQHAFDPLRLAIAMAATILVYPLVWYLLHRFILHGRWLYKSSSTAALWKRIHFDHHQNPNDLSVLFGALHTTVPTIAIVTVPIGWAIAGPAGSAAAFGMGVFVTCFYEFCHCIQHLSYKPRSAFLKRMKYLHLSHHFHNEQGNYGITNFAWDKVLGTYYAQAGDVPKSATVRNLGYADEEAERYPWVAELTEQTPLDDTEARQAG